VFDVALDEATMGEQPPPSALREIVVVQGVLRHIDLLTRRSADTFDTGPSTGARPQDTSKIVVVAFAVVSSTRRTTGLCAV
jgi:hypothetical protein